MDSETVVLHAGISPGSSLPEFRKNQDCDLGNFVLSHKKQFFHACSIEVPVLWTYLDIELAVRRATTLAARRKIIPTERCRTKHATASARISDRLHRVMNRTRVAKDSFQKYGITLIGENF